MEKKSQSAIVSSVLLILLVIAAVALIFSFVIPFIKEKLSSGNCLDVAGKIEIKSGYTCYKEDSSKMQVQVHIADIRNLIEGFSIEIGGHSTENYKIKEEEIEGITMCNGSAQIYLPEDNTEKTYVIGSAKPDVIRVYPILKGGKVCDASDILVSIDNCWSAQECSENV